MKFTQFRLDHINFASYRLAIRHAIMMIVDCSYILRQF